MSLLGLCESFGGGKYDDERKAHWIAWEKFTRCKGQGGLGFSDFRVFNQGLLARQAWRHIEFPDSLCARILKAKYFPNGDLLDTSFPSQVSPTWKAIMHGQELLKKGAIWRIGNGARIKIWQHAWIEMGPSGRKRACRLKWVRDLIDEENRCWKEDLLDCYFYQHDVEAIKKISIPCRATDDLVAWHFEKSGCFLVRSAYRLGVDLRDVDGGIGSSSSCPGGRRPV